MSSQAQMDACGVLCHMLSYLLPTGQSLMHRATRVTTMDKADLPRLFFVRMLPRCPVDVLRAGPLCTVCSPSLLPE